MFKDLAKIIIFNQKIKIQNLVQFQIFTFFGLFPPFNEKISKKIFWPVTVPILHQIHEFILLRYIKQIGKKVRVEITKHPHVKMPPIGSRVMPTTKPFL